MALGGIGEIGMNCYLYGLGPPDAQQVADDRSRHHLPGGRERPRRRRHPARSALHRGGAGEPGRPRPHARARGPPRRGHRAVAAAQGADLCNSVHGGDAEIQARRLRRQAEAADQGGAAQRPLRRRPVRSGARSRSRTRSPSPTRSPSARRTASCCTPATGRSTPRPRSGRRRTRPGSGSWAPTACWR